MSLLYITTNKPNKLQLCTQVNVNSVTSHT